MKGRNFSLNCLMLQTEDLSELSPSVVSSAGVVCMEHSSDVWKRMVDSWLMCHQEEQRKSLRQLCDRYLPPAFDFLKETVENVPRNSSELKRIVWQSDGNVISMFTALFEVGLMLHYIVLHCIESYCIVLKLHSIASHCVETFFTESHYYEGMCIIRVRVYSLKQNRGIYTYPGFSGYV